jgi:hypothetical protein
VTHLRKIMLEELQRHHYSEVTTQRYIRLVERFAQHFHCSPDHLGTRQIREYQAQLFTVQKLSPGSVTNHTLCPAVFPHSDAEKAVEHCRHALSEETPPPAHDSQSGGRPPFSMASCTFPGIWRSSRNHFPASTPGLSANRNLSQISFKLVTGLGVSSGVSAFCDSLLLAAFHCTGLDG